MWYPRGHENTYFYPTCNPRRTAPGPGGIAFVGCLRLATLPDFAGFCPWERAPTIARQLGCDDQTVRNVIKGFNSSGLGVLKAGSSRPHRLRTTFSEEGAKQLKDLLHRSPRDFGEERGTWTLELAAQASFEQGIIATQVSSESVRRALKRLGTNWKRAKHWITSPDPQYQQKKTHVIG
jgi:transposase